MIVGRLFLNTGRCRENKLEECIFRCGGCDKVLPLSGRYVMDNDGDYWHLMCAMKWSEAYCDECTLITSSDYLCDDDMLCPECSNTLRKITKKEALKIQRARLVKIEI